MLACSPQGVPVDQVYQTCSDSMYVHMFSTEPVEICIFGNALSFAQMTQNWVQLFILVQ